MECCEKRDGGDPSFVRLIISPKPLNLFGPAPPEYKRPAELRCERVGKRPEFFLSALHPNSHQTSLHIFLVIFRQEDKMNGVRNGADRRQLSNTFSKVRLFVS